MYRSDSLLHAGLEIRQMIGYLWFLRVIGVALAVLSAASAVMNFAYRDDRLWRLASARLPFNMTIVTPILRKMGGNDYMRELEALQQAVDELSELEEQQLVPDLEVALGATQTLPAGKSNEDYNFLAKDIVALDEGADIALIRAQGRQRLDKKVQPLLSDEFCQASLQKAGLTLPTPDGSDSELPRLPDLWVDIIDGAPEGLVRAGVFIPLITLIAGERRLIRTDWQSRTVVLDLNHSDVVALSKGAARLKDALLRSDYGANSSQALLQGILEMTSESGQEPARAS